MNRTQKKINSKKIALFAALIVVISLSGSAAAYYLYSSTANDNATSSTEDSLDTNTDNPSANDSPNADSEGKQNFLDNESKPDSEQSPAFSSDKIAISIKESTSGITVSTQLTGFSGEGICTLKVTKGTTTISKSAEVIYQAEYSTCAGFSIDKSDLSAGTWNIELSVADQGKIYSQTSEFLVKS